MKTAQERREQMAIRFDVMALAEKIEPYIDNAAESGQNHLTISSGAMCIIDPNYPQGVSMYTLHRYYLALANVYKEHGFKVCPIQYTDRGYDDCIYWRGFDVFW